MIAARRRQRAAIPTGHDQAAVRFHRRLPGSMFARELVITVGRPRALVIKLAMPLGLSLPLLLGHAPVFWAATLLGVLVAMTGAVGSAVSMARARDAGLLTRLAVVPGAAPRLLGGWVAAALLVDALQLLPALAATVLLGAGTPTDAAMLVVTALAVLLTCNALGCAVALLAGGTGEVLLDVAVLLAPLLFLGGLFTGIPASGWRHVAGHADIFAALHSALVAMLGGVPTIATGPALAIVAAWAIGAAVLIAGCAGRLLGRR